MPPAAPPFGEVYAPTNPAGLTLARQLWWQESAWPEAFARTRAILPWAQILDLAADRHPGVGDHLRWGPRPISGRRARAGSRAWRGSEAGTGCSRRSRPAGSAAGPLRPDLAARTGVAPGTPVLVGVHDS